MTRVDYHEAETTISAVPANGSSTADIPIPTLRKDFRIVRIYEVVLAGPSSFTVELYENGARTLLNRVMRVEGIVNHTFQRFIEGFQYMDRDVTPGLGQQATFHLTVYNNTASPADITVRIRYLPFYAR